MEHREAITEVTVDMSNVLASDHHLVRDVCAVLATLYRKSGKQTLERIPVTSSGQIYFVVATFAKGAVTEICKSDLDTLADVNPLRVTAASVLHDGECLHVKVRVCSFDHPVTVTDAELVRVVKKRRWGLFSG